MLQVAVLLWKLYNCSRGHKFLLCCEKYTAVFSSTKALGTFFFIKDFEQLRLSHRAAELKLRASHLASEQAFLQQVSSPHLSAPTLVTLTFPFRRDRDSILLHIGDRVLLHSTGQVGRKGSLARVKGFTAKRVELLVLDYKLSTYRKSSNLSLLSHPNT